jgi:hypothetical protein
MKRISISFEKEAEENRWRQETSATPNPWRFIKYLAMIVHEMAETGEVPPMPFPLVGEKVIHIDSQKLFRVTQKATRMTVHISMGTLGGCCLGAKILFWDENRMILATLEAATDSDGLRYLR